MTVLALAGALVGAAIGSWLGCVAYRVPRRLALSGRSRCPACGVQLPGYWNLPVIGWILRRGRAACCGERIPARYLLIELAGAFAGALLTGALGLVALALSVLVLVALPLVVSASTRRRSSRR